MDKLKTHFQEFKDFKMLFEEVLKYKSLVTKLFNTYQGILDQIGNKFTE